MKLYYSPGACSQAAHIVLHEAGLDHDSEAVDLRAHRTAGGADYDGINPKGAVPALELDGGEVLTENGAVMQYLGDLAGDTALLPARCARRSTASESWSRPASWSTICAAWLHAPGE